MEIRFIGKNMSVTKPVESHLREKLMKLEKYSPKLVECQTVLRKEKYRLKAEMTLFAKDLRVYGEAESKENIFTAIDMAYTRIEKQLKKKREKVKTHHKEHGVAAVPLKVKAAEELNHDRERTPRKRPMIVRTEDFAVKPMSAEEASMQLALLKKETFLVFLNPITNRVSVLYKRKDGNHGLIEPGI